MQNVGIAGYIQSMPLLLIEESKNTNLIFIWSGLTGGRNHDLQTGDRGIRTAIPNSPIYFI
jgi:hypothetical protein